MISAYKFKLEYTVKGARFVEYGNSDSYLESFAKNTLKLPKGDYKISNIEDDED